MNDDFAHLAVKRFDQNGLTGQTCPTVHVRTFLVNLLEKGEIPFRKVGAHRRVLLKDVLEYKERCDHQRANVLDELTAFSQDNDMGY